MRVYENNIHLDNHSYNVRLEIDVNKRKDVITLNEYAAIVRALINVNEHKQSVCSSVIVKIKEYDTTEKLEDSDFSYIMKEVESFMLSVNTDIRYNLNLKRADSKHHFDITDM